MPTIKEPTTEDLLYNAREDNKKLKQKIDNYKQALEETLKILCNGKTFYEGYFDSPILSRADKAIKVINEVLGDSEDANSEHI